MRYMTKEGFPMFRRSSYLPKKKCVPLTAMNLLYNIPTKKCVPLKWCTRRRDKLTWPNQYSFYVLDVGHIAIDWTVLFSRILIYVISPLFLVHFWYGSRPASVYHMPCFFLDHATPLPTPFRHILERCWYGSRPASDGHRCTTNICPSTLAYTRTASVSWKIDFLGRILCRPSLQRLVRLSFFVWRCPAFGKWFWVANLLVVSRIFGVLSSSVLILTY
jgi:hypothetical protein